jgi:hypothetical protein
MPTRCLHAYLKKNTVYLIAMSGVGVKYGSGEPVILPASDLDKLAAGLERAFAYVDASGDSARPRTRDAWVEHEKRFLRALGYKSFSAFERGTAFTVIDERDEGYDLTREVLDEGAWAERRVTLPRAASMRDIAEQLLRMLRA